MEKQKKITIKAFVRKDANKKKVEQPIAVRYSYKKSPFVISTGKFINPLFFDDAAGFAKVGFAESEEINDTIREIIRKLENVVRKIKDRGEEPIKDIVQKEYLGNKEYKSSPLSMKRYSPDGESAANIRKIVSKLSFPDLVKTLERIKAERIKQDEELLAQIAKHKVEGLDISAADLSFIIIPLPDDVLPPTKSYLDYLDEFIQLKNGGIPYRQMKEYIANFRKLNPNEKLVLEMGVYTHNTLKAFYALFQNIEDFQAKLEITLTLDKIDKTLLTKFQTFQIGKGYLNTTIAKRIKTLRQVINHFAEEGATDNAKHKNFKNKGGNKKRTENPIIPTEDELLAIMGITGLTTSKQYVLDLFLTSCFTGLRYSDIIRIKQHHIKQGKIVIDINKSDEWSEIPLNDYSNMYLGKYNYNFKIISNNTFNTTLKEVLSGLPELQYNEVKVGYNGSKPIEEVKPKYLFFGSHTGRRTFINICLEKSVNPAVIKGWVGHADIDMMMNYVNKKQNHIKEMKKIKLDFNLG